LGWNPGTEQELFSMNELIHEFDIEKVGKSGARFDYEKAKWFNHQYIASKTNKEISQLITPLFEKHNIDPHSKFATDFCGLMKDRVHSLKDFETEGYYFFSPVKEYDQSTILKKWNPDIKTFFNELLVVFSKLEDFNASALKTATEGLMTQYHFGPGQVLPVFRIALTGTMKGPGVFEMLEALGKEKSLSRLPKAFDDFDNMS
jgi:glutamyl-tRNA synthetase